MVDKDMTKMMERELRKIRDYPRFHFHSFAYAQEIDSVRARLRLAGVNFRTRPVTQNKTIIGYNIFISD